VLVDLAAVIADRRGYLQAAGGQPGQRAAPAVAYHADLSGLPRGLHRGGDVGHHVVPGEHGSQLPPLGHARLVIVQLDARPNPVEQRRGDREITLLGVAVGHRADMVVDPEDLLADDQPAPRPAGRARDIGVQLVAVGGGQLPRLSHGVPPGRFRFGRAVCHTLKRK
jgi:hypothetical protein